MNFEDLLDEQLEHVRQAFQDFEALKRVWARSQGDSNAFGEYSAEFHESIPELDSPFETKSSNLQAYEPDCNDHDDDDPGVDRPWNRFLAVGENLYDHAEVVPPHLITDYSMIDAEDPIFHTGARLGLPTYMSLHSPYAGNLMLMRSGLYGEKK